MKIKVVGAAGGEVTGSAYIIETSQARVLVDCGMFQGSRQSEALNRPPDDAGGRLDAVMLTHGHLDHTGRLPLLPQLGWSGPIYGTSATHEMAALILRDSARIQAQDAKRQNRKRARAGKPAIDPLYTGEEAEAAIANMREIHYDEPVEVAPGIEALWGEAGHMLGSGSIRLTVQDEGQEKVLLFSGDLGPRGIPILRDFESFHQADMVFLESTYGDRNHRPFNDTVMEFVDAVKRAVKAGGKILVPTFAVGRAQLLTVLLAWMFRTQGVKPFPVFLDSPMAIKATDIYARHQELFDDEMKQFMAEGSLREDLRTLEIAETPEESRRINGVSGTCLVMAGAGMCNAGRILHHLRQNVWKPETQLIFVGYQGRGSLGRRIIERQSPVRIHGERVVVKAGVHTLNGFSAHAGQTDLLGWFESIAPSRPRVVLVHGENRPRRELAGLIRSRFDLQPHLPEMGEVIEL